MQPFHFLMHNTTEITQIWKSSQDFFIFSIKRICNISFSSKLWKKVVSIGKDTSAHLLLKFRKGKKNNSQKVEKSGNLEGNALFSQLNLNPTKLCDNMHSLCVHAFYLSAWGNGWGGNTNQLITSIFHLGNGVKLEGNLKSMMVAYCSKQCWQGLGFFPNAVLIKWFRCSTNAVWLDSTVIQRLGTILLILSNCWCRMGMYRCSRDLYRRMH